MSEEASSSGAPSTSEAIPEVARKQTSVAFDRARAARELEEARRLYDVAALVHERSGLGSADSAPIAYKAVLLLMRVIGRMHGAAPSDPDAIAETQRINARENLVSYDVTEDLTAIAAAKDRFYDLERETQRADNRRYDRAFLRSAKLFSAAQEHLTELVPESRPSPARHLKLVLVAVLALGLGFVLGSHGRRPAAPEPPRPEAVPAAAATPQAAPTESAAPSAPGEVTTTFFRDPELKQAAFTRTDTRIDFNWAGDPPPGLEQNDYFSVRLTGKLNVTERASYDFFLTSDDGSRLFVDDALVIDNWGVHSPETKQGSLELEAGAHAFRVEFFDGTGNALVKLEWSSSRQPRRVVAGQDLR